jgi:hypothetical protein
VKNKAIFSFLFLFPFLSSAQQEQTSAQNSTLEGTLSGESVSYTDSDFSLEEAPAILAQTPDIQFNEKREQSDFEALRKWIREKRLVTMREIGGDLSLSGEVRTEFQWANETADGIRQRGSQAATSRPNRTWDVELNFMLDYRTDRTWAVIKIEYDNDMGVRGGTLDGLALEKAYFGGRIIDGDTFTWDTELGRRGLGTVFDSKVMYASLFDGLLFKFSKAFVSIGDFFVNAGAFVVDEKNNHYGYVAEIGMLRVGNTGFLMKASTIDWKKRYSDPLLTLRFDFVVSQLILGYQFFSQSWEKLVKFYAAGLYNWTAQALPVTANKRLNYGWYAGISVGQVRKKGDWALDMNYQYVAPQCIPSFDVSGIGHGNAAGVGLYTRNINGSGGPTTREIATGNGNYKGFVVELLYAFTDNITLLENFEYSVNQDRNVGPFIRYKKFEAEFIYAF